MSYNDPMGEWIRPRTPEIVGGEPPPRYRKTDIRRTTSCPDTVSIRTGNKKLSLQSTDLDALSLWDRLLTNVRQKITIKVELAGEDQADGNVQKLTTTTTTLGHQQQLDITSLHHLSPNSQCGPHPGRKNRSRSAGQIQDHFCDVSNADVSPSFKRLLHDLWNVRIHKKHREIDAESSDNTS